MGLVDRTGEGELPFTTTHQEKIDPSNFLNKLIKVRTPSESSAEYEFMGYILRMRNCYVRVRSCFFQNLYFITVTHTSTGVRTIFRNCLSSTGSSSYSKLTVVVAWAKGFIYYLSESEE